MRLCAKMKQLNLSNNLTDNIVKEWQNYRLDDDDEILCDDFMKVGDRQKGSVLYQRIDAYWSKVLKLTNKYTGKKKYENLSILVKSCLSLSHGNADVERGFSVNNWIVSCERTSLAEKTIVGVRLVKDAIRRHGSILKVPITKNLLKSVTKSYSFYKEDKLKEQEAAVKEQAAKQMQCESQQLHKKLKSESKEKLAELKSNIKSLKNDLNIAQAILNEGNERLQKAIKQRDFKEMSVASSMIETGTVKVKIQTEKLVEAEKKKSKSDNSK